MKYFKWKCLNGHSAVMMFTPEESFQPGGIFIDYCGECKEQGMGEEIPIEIERFTPPFPKH